MDRSPFRRETVLLVETDFRTSVSVCRALRDVGLLEHLVVMGNCEEALAYLHDPETVQPNLILLDLDMPHDLAISLLVRLKEDAWLKAIPVVILASPGSRLDVSECYALGAAGCMVKSNVRDELLEKLKAFSLYWRLNRLPALG